MKIYIAYNCNEQVTGVLLAGKREKADIAQAGMNLIPHSVEELDPAKATGLHGVVFLLTSEKVEHYIDGKFQTFINIKRGLQLMRTLLIAILISLLAGPCLAAGTMKYDSPKEVGLKAGEALIRFNYRLGLTHGLSLKETVSMVEMLTKEAYHAGEDELDVEELVDEYVKAFNKSYAAGRQFKGIQSCQ